jgi:hypothetical protein
MGAGKWGGWPAVEFWPNSIGSIHDLSVEALGFFTLWANKQGSNSPPVPTSPERKAKISRDADTGGETVKLRQSIKALNRLIRQQQNLPANKR